MTTRSFCPFRSEEAKAEFTKVYQERAKTWPVPSETTLVDTAAGQTFVRISGRVGNPPLVLLSGATGTSLMWADMIKALSADYRTYALDTITDIGLSVPRDRLSKPRDFVRWLDDVFRVLVPSGQLSLMGMSYGGWLASQYALFFPDRLQKVILLAPGCTVLRLSFSFVARVMLLLMPLPGAKGTALLRTFRWIFQDTIRSGEAGRKLVEEDLLIWAKSGQRYFRLPRLPWATVLTDEQWRKFPVPALFLVGENEKIYSPRAAVTRLNRLAPQIKTEIVPGAGHDLTIIKPDLVAKKVLAFLDEPAACHEPGQRLTTHNRQL